MFEFFDGKPWFAPKRLGYGAGLPLAWQGWVMMGLHLVAILSVMLVLRDHRLAQIIAIFSVGLVPLPLYAAKTRGGWKWRWNRDD